MAYIAWVRYGTSNHGYDEYLTTSDLSGALMLSPAYLNPAMRFDTLEEAKKAVRQWCNKTRAELVRAGLHSGKAWNQTREGAWKYEQVEDLEDTFINKPTTIWTF
jgi:hypothetical protein